MTRTGAAIGVFWRTKGGIGPLTSELNTGGIRIGRRVVMRRTVAGVCQLMALRAGLGNSMHLNSEALQSEARG